MVTYLDEMMDTVDSALRSEPETVQVKWAEARNQRGGRTFGLGDRLAYRMPLGLV